MDSDLTHPSAGLVATSEGVTHETSIREQGAFTTAICSCGWFAPARRSRDKSRRDAAEHQG